jgi:aspartyl-tRNA(Asn)/glutamyl-tRNA(Gln) amidotransferase subunit A
VRVPGGDQLNTVAQITLLSEAAAVHEPYIRKQRAAYGADVAALIDMGRVLPAVDYLQAQRLRRRMQAVYLEQFEQVDCLLVPATPMEAPRIGQLEVKIAGRVDDTRLASTRLVRGFNALGLPALAIPAGFTDDGLPLGAQLVGRPWDEARLLKIGAALEERSGFWRRRPGA